MVFRLVHTKRLCHNCYIDGQNGYATSSAITVLIKKIKGAAHQCYGDRIIRCEPTLRSIYTKELHHHHNTLNIGGRHL